MIRNSLVLLTPSAISVFLAMFLLGASPSERSDWEGVSQRYVLFLRCCWGVSAGLALATASMLVLRRPAVPLAVALYFAALVLLIVLMLFAVIEPYFRWSTI